MACQEVTFALNPATDKNKDPWKRRSDWGATKLSRPGSVTLFGSGYGCDYEIHLRLQLRLQLSGQLVKRD